jgi:hypothetical protein
MIYGRKGTRPIRSRQPGGPRRPQRTPKIKYWLPILALSFLASGPILAQGSTGPKPEESKPVSPQPERLFTEAQALAAATVAAEAAIGAAIPLAVQAAVADEWGRAAAQQGLDRAAAEAFRRQARTWRCVARVTALASAGALAESGRGAMYGAVGGALTATIWWLVESWPWGRLAGLSP